MSMYVDSLMMAEMVRRNMCECTNKCIVQLLVVKTYIYLYFPVSILPLPTMTYDSGHVSSPVYCKAAHSTNSVAVDETAALLRRTWSQHGRMRR